MSKRFYILIIVFVIPLYYFYALEHNEIHLDPEEFVGIWHGSYFGGEEKFEIKKDGSFYQEFSINNKIIYKNTAYWKPFEEYPNKKYGTKGIKVSGATIWCDIEKFPATSAKFDKNQEEMIPYININLFSNEKALFIGSEETNNGYFIEKVQN